MIHLHVYHLNRENHELDLALSTHHLHVINPALMVPLVIVTDFKAMIYQIQMKNNIIDTKMMNLRKTRYTRSQDLSYRAPIIIKCIKQ